MVIGGTTGLSPVFSSRTNASSFHSLASSSSLQFQTTTTNKDQKRFFAAGKRDYYSVLGVPKGSDKSSIKKAYFKLAKEHHPDTNNVSRQSFMVTRVCSLNKEKFLTEFIHEGRCKIYGEI